MHAWNSCLHANGRPKTCRCAPYSSAVWKQSSAAPVMPQAMPCTRRAVTLAAAGQGYCAFWPWA